MTVAAGVRDEAKSLRATAAAPADQFAPESSLVARSRPKVGSPVTSVLTPPKKATRRPALVATSAGLPTDAQPPSTVTAGPTLPEAAIGV